MSNSYDLNRINKSLINIVTGRARVGDAESQFGLAHLQLAINNTSRMRAEEKAARTAAWETRVEGEYRSYIETQNAERATLLLEVMGAPVVDISGGGLARAPASDWDSESGLSKGKDANSTAPCKATYLLMPESSGDKNTFVGSVRAILQMIKHANDKDAQNKWKFNPFYSASPSDADPVASQILEFCESSQLNSAIEAYNAFAVSQNKPTIQQFLKKN